MILTIFPLFNYSWPYYWISDFWVQKNEVCWDSRETSRFVDAPGPHRHQPRHYVSCHGNHNVYNDNNHSSLDVMCLIVSGFSATVCKTFQKKKNRFHSNTFIIIKIFCILIVLIILGGFFWVIFGGFWCVSVCGLFFFGGGDNS